MKNILVILLIVMAFQAQAALPSQPMFSWSAPTQFEDGSSLDALADLERYNLNCDNGLIDIDLDASATSYTADAGTSGKGTHTCVMTSISKEGISSIDSLPKSFGVNYAPMQIIFTVN